MLVPFTEAEYLAEARDRVTEQFKEKGVFDRYLQLLIEQQSSLQQVFKDLIQKRSVDEATGETLDVIGRIVGQPRELISANLFKFFGFQGALAADTFGELGVSGVGSRFFNLGESQSGNVLLDDPTYRLFIKAKILKNRTASTPEEFLTFVNFLFGTETSAILSEGEASYTILFGRELSPFEQVLLNYVSTSQGYESRLIPKTVGVRVNFGYFVAENYFGFQGAPGALGFGDNPLSPQVTQGYGINYGQAYGGALPTQELIYDGSSTHNGFYSYIGEVDNVNPPPTAGGGIFATLF